MWTENFQMFKLDLEKSEELEIKLLTFARSYRKWGNPRRTSTSVSLTMPKPLTLWNITKYGKLSKRWEYQTILPVSWETCMRIKNKKSQPCMEQLTGSRLRKDYDRTVCRHRVCLTYTLSTSWEILGWMSYKLESRFLGEISATQLCRQYHSNGRKWRGIKETIDKGERREWKSWIKIQHSYIWLRNIPLYICTTSYLSITVNGH